MFQYLQQIIFLFPAPCYQGTMNRPLNSQPEAALLAALGGRCIVLICMMGSGKTSVGQPLAARLGLDFTDADAEIEAAHCMRIPEIFAQHGEVLFS